MLVVLGFFSPPTQEHVDQYLPMTIMGVFSIIGALSLAILKDKLSPKYRQRKQAKQASIYQNAATINGTKHHAAMENDDPKR